MTVEAPPPAIAWPLTLISSRSSSHSTTVRSALSTFPPVVSVTLMSLPPDGRRGEVLQLGCPCWGTMPEAAARPALTRPPRTTSSRTLDNPNDQRFLDFKASSPLASS